MKEQLKSKLIRLLQFIQVKWGFPPAVASKLIGKVLGIKSAPIEFGIEGSVAGCVSKICYNFK
jgi:hypothetical protein